MWAHTPKSLGNIPVYLTRVLKHKIPYKSYPQSSWYVDILEEDKLFSIHCVCIDLFQNGQTALILAAEKGHIDIIQELLGRGANVNAQDEVSGLFLAC